MSPQPVRRSQAIAPFGVGAIVDFPGPVSLIHGGLDVWPFDESIRLGQHKEFVIEDEIRLAGRLGVDYFVHPPDYRYVERGEDASGRQNLYLKLPFLRFPRWHVCPRCGRMFEQRLHDNSAMMCEGPIATGKDKGKKHKKRRTVQVRFIAACRGGHLSDFPWWEWVFQESNPETSGLRLRMNTSGSASLAGVQIVCEKDDMSCKVVKRITLARAFNADFEDESSALSRIGVICQGENPALGIPSSTTPAPGCGKVLYPLLKGGSNVYFPNVVSSIYLPPIDTNTEEGYLELLENPYFWHIVNTNYQCNVEMNVNTFKGFITQFFPDKDIDPKKLAEITYRKLRGEDSSTTEIVDTDTPEQAYRREEYVLFSSDIHEGYPKTNLLIKSEKITSYETIISEYFERIALVHKLRETRAFVGFSRIFPGNAISTEDNWQLISRSRKNWLPATIVRGEGIFIQFREDIISKWVNDNSSILTARISDMRNTFDQVRLRLHQEHREVTPRFVMLHALSHLLINQLIYECGYGSASLRERLYCAEGDKPMAGILIYTAAGDAEGTMGGLVRMGKPGRIETIIRSAIENAKWCSTDPVCIESVGQGPDNCNLAACHSCTLLPETSCEEGNRLLDRALLIGTLDLPGMGFFSNLL